MLAILALALQAAPSPADGANVTTEVPFAATQLDLDLQVDYEHLTITGRATLRCRNVAQDRRRHVPLLLNRLMTVSRVLGPDGKALRFQQQVRLFDDDSTWQVNTISVDAGRPVAAGDSIGIVVEYGGTLVGYTETGSLYIQDHVSRDFTIIREDAFAFPRVGVASWRAYRASAGAPFRFRASVTVPAGLVVAMGGEQEAVARRDSVATWRYRSDEAVPFLNIAIAPYRVIDRPGARIFHFSGDSAGAQMVDRAIAGAVRTFSSWFGPLLREPRLIVMEIPEGYGSQASLIAGILQTADAFRNHTELRQLYHELSHLWNPRDLDTPSPRWNEGLASFLQWRMAAELDGWNDWDVRIERMTKSLLGSCGPPAPCDSVPMARFGDAGATDRSYPLGMLMFTALFRALGADAFDRGYRAFYQRYRESGATTADLVASFRSVSSKSDAIFADWLETTRWHKRLTSGETFAQIVASYN